MRDTEGRYDKSYIRHEDSVPVDQILRMSGGERALLRAESGTERVDTSRVIEYSRHVLKELGESSGDYKLELVVKDGKTELIIERLR